MIHRRNFLSGAAAATSLCAIAGQARSAPVAAAGDIDTLVQAERNFIVDTLAQDGIEGASVSLLHDGKAVWTEGFGVTDRAPSQRVDDQTIFSIQSTSKNLTATATMIAVQRGLLDLDTPITAYLPDFAVQSRFEQSPQDKITLRLLLGHRAGFTHEAPVGNNYDAAFPDFAAHVRSISRTWLRYPVGERYRYSNLGYDLAGYVLETRCGMPFAGWMRETLFAPLGMTDSTMAAHDYSSRRNRAVGHDTGHATVPLVTPLIPSGGVYTSARDMALYAMFHLAKGKAGGNVVLREDLWNEMHGFALGGDYSLGVIREEMRYGDTRLRLLSHKGGGFGFGSVFQYCPEAQLAWVAMFNRPADGAYRFGAKLVDALLTARYGARKPRLPAKDLAPIALTVGQLRPFVGTYVGRNANATFALANGQLRMREDRDSTVMAFTSPTDGFTTDASGDTRTWRFYPARSGEPAHFECWVGEDSLDYNDGQNDAPGPDAPHWHRFLGRYRIYQWGVATAEISIRPRNGYLYLNDIKLIAEAEPGLFFTSDGEAVDFRSAQPTWKNIRLVRVM